MKDVLSAKRCAPLLKALAAPERLRLVQALRERPQSVTDLSALLDNDIANISHHLKILRKQGIVTNLRVGRSIIYALSKSVFAAKGSSRDTLDFGCCSLELPR